MDIKSDIGKLLKEVVPSEIDATAFSGMKSLLNKPVTAAYESSENPWIGSYKNVNVWWIVNDTHMVGWNESPSRGWSFQVIPIRTGG